MYVTLRAIAIGSEGWAYQAAAYENVDAVAPIWKGPIWKERRLAQEDAFKWAAEHLNCEIWSSVTAL